MRLTDDRYANEKAQFDLAMRMIRHEARTGTITECTGLSDDRIRKLYGTYFRSNERSPVRRRRGKSPQQVQFFVKNAFNQLEATTLVALYAANLLIRIEPENRVQRCWPRPDVEYGHRLCRAYETYQLLHPKPLLNFEWAWALLQHISRNDELYLAGCAGCTAVYVQDAYALDNARCPACSIAVRNPSAPRPHGGRRTKPDGA
ncbi:MAG: FlhC family transcriptional regulator [Pseudomonadota bacterium]